MESSRRLLFSLFVLGLGALGEGQAPLTWNAVADSLLEHARNEIVQQEKTRVPLPDIHETFSRKKGFIRVKGDFRATGGWLESFASLHRVGDVTVTPVGSATVMTAVLGLSDLRLGYASYEARVWGGGPDGTLEGKIGKNAVRFVIKFDEVDGECVTTLEALSVVEFDDFDVTVSGLGSFDWLAEKIVEWAVNKRRGDIRESIERQLTTEMNKTLRDFECEQYATLMIPI